MVTQRSCAIKSNSQIIGDALRDALDHVSLFDLNHKMAHHERPQRDIDRLRKQNKLLVRERLALLLDPGTPFLELSSLAAWGERARRSIWRYCEFRWRRASPISDWSSLAEGGAGSEIRSAKLRDLACWMYRNASAAADTGSLSSIRD